MAEESEFRVIEVEANEVMMVAIGTVVVANEGVVRVVVEVLTILRKI